MVPAHTQSRCGFSQLTPKPTRRRRRLPSTFCTLRTRRWNKKVELAHESWAKPQQRRMRCRCAQSPPRHSAMCEDHFGKCTFARRVTRVITPRKGNLRADYRTSTYLSMRVRTVLF